MRTIKFRAKRKDNEKWVYGSLLKTPHGTYIERYEDSIRLTNEVATDTVCQFTGLFDSTGKEIYEGDILRLGPVICEVLWREYLGGFYLKEDFAIIPGTTPFGLMLDGYEYEVIGNIFDNKEDK